MTSGYNSILQVLFLKFILHVCMEIYIQPNWIYIIYMNIGYEKVQVFFANVSVIVLFVNGIN